MKKKILFVLSMSVLLFLSFGNITKKDKNNQNTSIKNVIEDSSKFTIDDANEYPYDLLTKVPTCVTKETTSITKLYGYRSGFISRTDFYLNMNTFASSVTDGIYTSKRYVTGNNKSDLLLTKVYVENSKIVKYQTYFSDTLLYQVSFNDTSFTVDTNYFYILVGRYGDTPSLSTPIYSVSTDFNLDGLLVNKGVVVNGKTHNPITEERRNIKYSLEELKSELKIYYSTTNYYDAVDFYFGDYDPTKLMDEGTYTIYGYTGKNGGMYSYLNINVVDSYKGIINNNTIYTKSSKPALTVDDLKERMIADSSKVTNFTINIDDYSKEYSKGGTFSIPYNVVYSDGLSEDGTVEIVVDASFDTDRVTFDTNNLDVDLNSDILTQLKSNITVDSGITYEIDESCFDDKLGTYIINVKCKDENNKEATLSFNANFIDTKDPVLNDFDLDLSIGYKETFNFTYLENKLKENVVDVTNTTISIDDTTYQENKNKVGTYPINVVIKDEASNTLEKTYYINVYDNVSPLIIGNNTTTSSEEKIDLDKFYSRIGSIDEIDGFLSSDRLTFTDLDNYEENYTKNGVYRIEVKAEDNSGNTSTQIFEIKVGTDTVIENPTIIITSGSPLTKEDVKKYLESIGEVKGDVTITSTYFDDETPDGTYDMEVTDGTTTKTYTIVVGEDNLNYGKKTDSNTKTSSSNKAIIILVIIFASGIVIASIVLGIIFYKKKH